MSEGEAKDFIAHIMVKRSATVSIRVTAEQKAALERLAKSERRKVSDLAYIWFEEALERRLKAEAASKKKAGP